MSAVAQSGDVVGVENWISDGLDASAANGVGQTALHVACLWGNAKIVEVLIKAGAKVCIGQ